MPVYIATHKKINIDVPEGYEIIQVGASLNEHFGYLTDANGDNISHKNPNYCELTALYYVWKNVKPDDNIVGLVHYRRFFYVKLFSINKKNILTAEQAKNYLNKYDIILPKLSYFSTSVETQYSKAHYKKDLEVCREIIKIKTPEYLPSFDKVMHRRHMFLCNMFIMRYKDFCKYMNWLFNILEEAEQKIDFEKYDKYNQRVFGFLSERLFNVWLDREQLKYHTVNVYNNEETMIRRLISELKNNVKKIIESILKLFMR